MISSTKVISVCPDLGSTRVLLAEAFELPVPRLRAYRTLTDLESFEAFWFQHFTSDHHIAAPVGAQSPTLDWLWQEGYHVRRFAWRGYQQHVRQADLPTVDLPSEYNAAYILALHAVHWLRGAEIVARVCAELLDVQERVFEIKRTVDRLKMAVPEFRGDWMAGCPCPF